MLYVSYTSIKKKYGFGNLKPRTVQCRGDLNSPMCLDPKNHGKEENIPANLSWFTGTIRNFSCFLVLIREICMFEDLKCLLT